MFFILSKILAFFISPLFWWSICILLALFGWNKKIKKSFRIITVFYFLFFSNTFLFLEVERLWEIPGTKIDSIQKKYDVGIVLSGMAMYNNDLERLQIQEGTDRIWHSISLYKKGIVSKLLISGKDGNIIDKGLNESVQFKSDLVKWGIPAEDIIIEDISRNTYENALYTKKVLEQHPEYNSFLLITSSNHMRRASACFKKQGMEFDVFTTNLYTGANRLWTFDHLFVPSYSTFVKWNNLTKEWTGYIMYKLTGKL